MTMNTPNALDAATGRTRKLILQVVTGMICGAGGMIAVMTLLDQASAGRPTAEQAIAAGVGLLYLLMGVFVGMGTANPSIGSKMLNVADEEEIADDRSLLLISSLTCILDGLALMILAFCAPRGPFPAELALALVAVAVVATLILWRRSHHLSDEFRRLVGAQASQAAFGLSFALFGGWAVLAHLGYVPLFGALGFIAGTMAMVLVGTFWVVGRRGLLTPR